MINYLTENGKLSSDLADLSLSGLTIDRITQSENPEIIQEQEQKLLKQIGKNTIIIKNQNPHLFSLQSPEIQADLKAVLEKSHARIFTPETDILITENTQNQTENCIILIDGWQSPEDESFLEEDSDNDTNDVPELKDE